MVRSWHWGLEPEEHRIETPVNRRHGTACVQRSEGRPLLCRGLQVDELEKRSADYVVLLLRTYANRYPMLVT